MTHELKTYPKYFQETIEGNKPFEIRKNDRNFQVGDVLILKEWDNIKYSGREIGAVVRYVPETLSDYRKVMWHLGYRF